MDRLACLDVEPLRLQILGLEEPTWVNDPMAVIATSGPEGAILELNAHALRAGLSLGMRYGTALSLCPGLRAQPVLEEAVDQQQTRLVAVARRFSPDVESFERGTLLLRASGLDLLTPSLTHWSMRLGRAVKRHLGLSSRIGVGFSRLGALVAARVRPSGAEDVRVLMSPDEEQQALADAPLEAFAALHPDVAAKLRKLAVTRISDLLALPGDGIRRRFGAELHRIYRLANGDIDAPLVPQAEVVPLIARLDLEPAERNAVRLLFRIKALLVPLLQQARQRQHMVREMVLSLESEAGRVLEERIGAAIPMIEVTGWVELTRLRLEHTPIDAGVGKISIELVTIRARPGQLALFAARSRRALEDAEQGLARVRAEFGAAAVVVASPQPVHVPEQATLWTPLTALGKGATESSGSPGKPFNAQGLSTVRRLSRRPATLEGASIKNLGPPSLVSWGWWCDPQSGDSPQSDHKQQALDREYRFAQLGDGRLVWLVTDRAAGPYRRPLWRIAATVE